MDVFEQFVDFATNAIRIPKSVSVGAMPGRLSHNSARRSSGGPRRILAPRLAGMGQIENTGAVLQASGNLVNTGADITGSVLSSATAGSTGMLATAASAIPYVGAAIAAGLAIAAALGLGQGCGNSCISAAEQEQVYEAAADNLNRVAKAGMIPGTVAAQLMSALISMAQQAEASQGTKASTAGASNAASVIQSEMSAAQALGSGITQPLNLSTAPQYYIPVGTSGWYANSLSAAQQLTTTLLQSYAENAPATTTVETASGATTTIPTTTGTIGGLSTMDILLLAAAALVMVMMF